MTNIQQEIASTIKACRNEIVEFIQEAVRLPSLADDEGPVQNFIEDKLRSLNLDVDRIPVNFELIKSHPAFCDLSGIFLFSSDLTFETLLFVNLVSKNSIKSFLKYPLSSSANTMGALLLYFDINIAILLDISEDCSLGETSTVKFFKSEGKSIIPFSFKEDKYFKKFFL